MGFANQTEISGTNGQPSELLHFFGTEITIPFAHCCLLTPSLYYCISRFGDREASLRSWRFWSRGVKSVGGKAARGMGWKRVGGIQITQDIWQTIFLMSRLLAVAALPPKLLTLHKKTPATQATGSPEFEAGVLLGPGSLGLGYDKTKKD